MIGRPQQVGRRAMAVQNPLTSLVADVEATRRIPALQDGPTVLVAHSWGGTVITEAGVDPKVSERRGIPQGFRLYAVQGRVSVTLFSGRTTKAAWR